MGKHAHVFRNGEGMKEALVDLQGLERELPSVRIEPVGGVRYNARLIEAIDVRWLLHVGQVVCRAVSAAGGIPRLSFPGGLPGGERRVAEAHRGAPRGERVGQRFKADCDVSQVDLGR